MAVINEGWEGRNGKKESKGRVKGNGGRGEQGKNKGERGKGSCKVKDKIANFPVE